MGGVSNATITKRALKIYIVAPLASISRGQEEVRQVQWNWMYYISPDCTLADSGHAYMENAFPRLLCRWYFVRMAAKFRVRIWDSNAVVFRLMVWLRTWTVALNVGLEKRPYFLLSGCVENPPVLSKKHKLYRFSGCEKTNHTIASLI